MKQLTSDVLNRVQKFLEILEAAESERPIPYERFAEIVESEGVGKARKGVGKREDVARKVRYALTIAGRRLKGGRSITLQDKNVKVTALQATVFDSRLQTSRIEKHIVADALLAWIFGKDNFKPKVEFKWFPPSDPNVQREDNTTGKYPESAGFNETDGLDEAILSKSPLSRIYRKLENLRRTAALMMLVDAGSTNFILIQQLLDARLFPFKVPVVEPDIFDPDGKPRRSSRLISPSIITNSIPIAQEINSSRHRRLIRLSLVGGTELPERRSICGESSMLWLRACQASGVIASADVAIVGPSGYRDNYVDGLPALGCDDPSEASLKAEMLKLAGNGLRICTMDSKRLLHTEFNCCFTAVTQCSLDLIVIDSGKKGEPTGKAVEELCEVANTNGVAVLVARRPDPRKKEK